MHRAGRSSGARDLGLVIGATLAIIVVPFLPATLLDNRPSVCVIKRATGRDCPGCGMTRALWRLAHGQVRQAVDSNWRVVIVAPVLLALYLRLAYRCIAGSGRQAT